MPVIARFYGIIIAMFFEDHNPPHFHARYGSFQVVIKIDDLAILTGEMPPRALGLIMEWAARHQQELKQNWELAWMDQPLKKILPLD
jgi:hypothetical protein